MQAEGTRLPEDRLGGQSSAEDAPRTTSPQKAGPVTEGSGLAGESEISRNRHRPVIIIIIDMSKI